MSASADTMLMLKRSPKFESKRLFKPTKLRHGTDESRTVRLLELNPGSLWFEDQGPTEETSHLINPNQGNSTQTTSDPINWIDVFNGDIQLSRQQIIERCSRYGVSARTVDRELKESLGKILDKPKDGIYKVKYDDTEEPVMIPVAA